MTRWTSTPAAPGAIGGHRYPRFSGHDACHRQWCRVSLPRRQFDHRHGASTFLPGVSVQQKVTRVLLECHRFSLGVDMERSQYDFPTVRVLFVIAFTLLAGGRVAASPQEPPRPPPASPISGEK